MKDNKKENKKELLDRIKKLYKKGGSVSSSALVMALQKVDAENILIEDDWVFSTDHTTFIYSRGKHEEVTVPAGTVTIGAQAFARKKKMKRVFLPAGLRKIGEEAFADCDGLTEVIIPASVEEIADYAFLDCDRLRRVVFMGMPKKMSRKAFEACDELRDIAVDDDRVKAMRKTLRINDGDINYLVVGFSDDNKKKKH